MTDQSLEAGVAVSENNDATGTDNLDFDSFMVSRLPAEEIPAEEEKVEPEKPEEEEVSVEEGEAETPEEEGKEEEVEPDETTIDDVLSQFDFDSMDAEQVAQLASQLKEHLHGSKSAERIGELTRKKKEAEELATRFQSELAQLKDSKNPLEKETPIEDNPFKDLSTVQELQDQYETLGQTEKWADQILEENPHADPDDIVAELDGKEYTKRQVREYKYNARDSREKYLPARLKDIQRAEQAKAQKAQSEELASKELSWLADEESDLRKEYEMLVDNEHVNKIREKVPELDPVLNRLLAHALNSIHGMKTKAVPTKRPKPAPPSTLPNATAKAPERDNERVKKQIGELANRFGESHSTDDWTSLRTAQIARKRKS